MSENKSSKTHKDLNVWKESMSLVLDIYEITRKFPDYEKFSLSNQMQRCAVSIPSNIAEGAARSSVKEFIQFLYISLGSLSELETQLIISYKLNYISDTNFKDLANKIEIIRKQLLNLIKYQKEKNKNDKTN